MKPEPQSRQTRSRIEAEVLAEAISHSITIITGQGKRARLSRQIASNIREPVKWYLEHVQWPSTLTAYGIPLELSLSLDRNGSPSFRYTVDLADHRLWLAGNWNRYLETAVKLTSAPQTSLFQLFTKHLDANPPATRSPVYHGVGYGSGNAFRSSIYFFIGGLSRLEFEQRFATEVAAIDQQLVSAGGRRPERYHGISYDFDETGMIRRTKFYAWLDLVSPLNRLSEHLGNQSDLTFIQDLMDHIRATLGPNRSSRSTILQSGLSGQPMVCAQKIFLHGPAWRLSDPKGQLELVKYLSTHSHANISHLYALLSVFETYSIPLLPVWVAIGVRSETPTLTFYFAPILDHVLSDLPSRETAERMLARAVEYLFACRSADGVWSDGAGGDPDYLVTARVAASLARVQGSQGKLHSTGTWLLEKLSGQDPQRVSEATAFSMLALSRLAVATPESAQRLEQNEGVPELVALNLLAALEAGIWSEPQIEMALERLTKCERWTGGWSGTADDLYVTVRAIEALRQTGELVPSRREQAEGMINRASFRFSDHPVSREPAEVGLWLKGLLLSGQNLIDASVTRALTFLSDCQQPEGQWLATPFQTTNGARAYLDPRCLFTTAIVVEALALLLDHTKH